MLLATGTDNGQTDMAKKLLEARLFKIKQQLLKIGNEKLLHEVFNRVLEKEIK